jgi:hypothetical protein
MRKYLPKVMIIDHLKMGKLFLLIVPLLILSSCEQKSEYEQLVEKELSKDVRHDSLFLGYELGMEKEQFFQHSWELNQKRVIDGGVQITYDLEELSSPAKMDFYPDFHNERIYRMPVEISYKAWAPWNPGLSSDSLMVELVDLYREKYGKGFIQDRLPEINKEAWIKVDGNRRISIYRKDEMTVRVEFLDLSVKREMSQDRE